MCLLCLVNWLEFATRTKIVPQLKLVTNLSHIQSASKNVEFKSWVYFIHCMQGFFWVTLNCKLPLILVAKETQKTEYFKKMKKLPCLHYNIQLSRSNSRIYANFIPFLFSFPKLLGPCCAFLQIYLGKFNGNMFQASSNFSINNRILACFRKCVSEANSLVIFLKS
jgi:hypothetical protein